MKSCLYPTLLLIPLFTGCVGVRQTDDTYTVHAETFHLVGLNIPGDDRDAAWAEVPEGAEIISVQSSPSDWHSILGVLNKLFGFSTTEITWRGGPPPETE